MKPKAKPVAVVDDGHLYTHRSYFGHPRQVSLKELGPGDVINFQYKGKDRWAFVLDPEYDDKLHALSLSNIPRSVLVENVISHMDVTDIPKVFYDLAMRKPIVVACDAYRTYLLKEISQVRRVSYTLDERAD